MRKVNHTSYFWQSDKVRLRAMELKGWASHYHNRFDTLQGGF